MLPAKIGRTGITTSCSNFLYNFNFSFPQKTPAKTRALLGASSTTGHADSPATIVIGKKVKKTVQPKPRKGRKSVVKVCVRCQCQPISLSSIVIKQAECLLVVCNDGKDTLKY